MALTLQSSIKLSSGYHIPRLGLGVYQNKKDCVSSCVAALKTGYRHIDTALIYRNHTEVGTGVQESGIPRDEIFITSKIVSKDQGYEQTLAKVDQSLNELGVSYIDLFLIHDPLGGSQKRLDTYRALIKSVSDGKVRSIGVSNYGIEHLEELKAANLGIAPAVNQLEIHPYCQLKEIVKYCKENSIEVEAYCPLGRAEYFHDAVIAGIAQKLGKTEAQEDRIISNGSVYDFELSAEQMTALDKLDRGRYGAVSWGGNIIVWKN
ncbi:Aldo/keto reductase family proteins [Phaffia rhodozyma]|uniref:Aldo/keto reductase family proteins n=1 Tax=Phaffia rhodozyma TaxID=264483 RepID=A0A0F7SIR4_PHARH|nr:Aldo/keto reductase family proteins [Phaffia rhodozyma]